MGRKSVGEVGAAQSSRTSIKSPENYSIFKKKYKKKPLGCRVESGKAGRALARLE